VQFLLTKQVSRNISSFDNNFTRRRPSPTNSYKACTLVLIYRLFLNRKPSTHLKHIRSSSYADPFSNPSHTFINLIPFHTSPCFIVLPHLVTGWCVDQDIMSEDERLVTIRFSRDWDPDCMRQDEVLYLKSFLFPFIPYLLILRIYRHRRPSQELCCHLCVRSRPGPRLQADVW
jgi:hypothetical protein